MLFRSVLATGGTAAASVALIEQAGGRVESVCMLMELSGLGGRDRLRGREVESVVIF